MNKKFLYAGVAVVVLVILYFIFSGSTKIKNYPSSGTDIVAFGDSLVQGVGASSDSTNFVAVLSRRIGKPIVNLGVSGNTTEDGLKRLGELDRYKPKVVIVLLGGNDYLKKVPIDTTFNNLEKIIKNIQSRGAVVLLLGVRGGVVTDKFDERFEDLADKTGSAYVSNVLDGLITKNEFMSDAIHPNNTGYAKIATRVYPVLQKLIK
jgi:acyl-CoA thioesterase I